MIYEGKQKLGDFFSSRRERGEAGLPTLSVTLENGLVKRDSLERKTDTNLEPEEHLLVHKGDIVYNMMRMWQGALGLASEKGIVSPAYIVLKPKKNINSEFAFYLFKTRKFIHRFWAYSYGLTSDRLRLYFNDFSKIPVTVPSLEEQTKIAKILSAWDKAIETVEALIENSKKQKKALMQQLLTGKKRFPGFSKKWIKTTISQIAEINPKKSEPPQNGIVSFVSMDSVSEEARLLKTEIRQYSEVSKGFSTFRNHDVLVAKITPCFENGKGAYVENLKNSVGFGSTEFHVLRTKNNNLSKFVYWITNTYEFRKRGEANMQGSVGQKRVPTDYFRAVKFMIPKDLVEQKRISEAISVADIEIEKYQLQLKKFKAEKMALKQKLLTERHRVG